MIPPVNPSWPRGLRGAIIHAVTKTGYSIQEMVARAFGSPHSRAVVQSLRRAEQAHWVALRLSDRGDDEAALRVARQGFAELRKVDPLAALPVWGLPLGVVLDGVAKRRGFPDEVLPELRVLLRALEELEGRFPSNRSQDADRILRWLRDRVG